MLTRCPHCETGFRVNPSQLKLRQGQVRCGVCQGIFNALDSLADERVPAPPLPAAAGAPPAEAEVAPAATALDASAAFPAAAGIADGTPAGTAPTAVDEVPADTAAALSGATAEIAVAAVRGGETDPALTSADEAEKSAVMPPQNGPEDAAAESRCWRDGTTASAAAAAAPEAAPTPDKISVPQAAPVPAVWEVVGDAPPPRRWPWIGGAVLLLVLAAGQLAYHFRVELAVLVPELRPALVASCEWLDCTLPRPRKAELIGIEASDLVPAGADRLLLTATLKNRAPFDQEYPHLELTLTDTQDKALLRRILAPADYLTAAHAPGDGFVPRTDVAIRLTLEIPGVPAVGYRLYLFYP